MVTLLRNTNVRSVVLSVIGIALFSWFMLWLGPRNITENFTAKWTLVVLAVALCFAWLATVEKKMYLTSAVLGLGCFLCVVILVTKGEVILAGLALAGAGILSLVYKVTYSNGLVIFAIGFSVMLFTYLNQC